MQMLRALILVDLLVSGEREGAHEPGTPPLNISPSGWQRGRCRAACHHLAALLCPAGPKQDSAPSRQLLACYPVPPARSPPRSRPHPCLMPRLWGPKGQLWAAGWRPAMGARPRGAGRPTLDSEPLLLPTPSLPRPGTAVPVAWPWLSRPCRPICPLAPPSADISAGCPEELARTPGDHGVDGGCPSTQLQVPAMSPSLNPLRVGHPPHLAGPSGPQRWACPCNADPRVGSLPLQMPAPGRQVRCEGDGLCEGRQPEQKGLRPKDRLHSRTQAGVSVLSF